MQREDAESIGIEKREDKKIVRRSVEAERVEVEIQVILPRAHTLPRKTLIILISVPFSCAPNN